MSKSSSSQYNLVNATVNVITNIVGANEKLKGGIFCRQKYDASSCKFLAQETFTTNMADNKYDTDNVSRKHSRPIKPRNLAPVYASSLRRTELLSVWCKKRTRKAYKKA